MFSRQIKPRTQQPISSFPSFLRQPQYSSIDLQYEICSKYMKMTSEQLYKRELQLIENTSKFIEKISDNLMQKDVSSTQESMSFDPNLEEEDVFTQETRSKFLLRKSYSNTNLRRTENGLSEALREVEKKCSEKTSKMLVSMASEFRKMKEKLASSQKLQKELKRMEIKYGTDQQELLVLRKRVSDLEKGNKLLQEQSHTLRKKLKDVNEQTKMTKLSLSKSSDNLKSWATPTPADKLKKYLEEKQLHIFKKEKQIKSIQEKIQISLEGSIISSDGCDKCCQLMKRIKESIMKYRTYLEEQANVAQIFYNKYKHLFS